MKTKHFLYIIGIILLGTIFFLSCMKETAIESPAAVSEKISAAEETNAETFDGIETEQTAINPMDVYINKNNTDTNKIHLTMENPLLRMEYPEYHSFIYRYSKLRDEQLIFLNEYISKNNIDVDIENSTTLNSTGFDLYEKKEYAEAIRFFREAAYLDPTNVYAHYNLACTLSLLRDSIWADPTASMDYFDPYIENDYYVDRYDLYRSSIDPNTSDESCRDEIYDHLTLAILQSERYLEKAPADSDLNGIHNHLRFRRLMSNTRNPQAKSIHGVYYVPNTDTKAVFFMLDGRVPRILVNDEQGGGFYFGTDEDIIESEEKEYTFDELITGYEYSDNTRGHYGRIMPGQWEYHTSPTIDFYRLQMELEMIYHVPGGVRTSPRKFDFTYFKERIKPHNVTENSFSFYYGDIDTVQFINIYKEPYRAIIYEDRTILFTYLDSDTAIDITEVAKIALLYERYKILDWLIKNYSEIALDNLMLTACMYSKIDFFQRLEAGGYGFSMESFINNKGAEMFLQVAYSDNMSFLEYLYKTYFNNFPKQQKDILNEKLYWSSYEEEIISNMEKM